MCRCVCVKFEEFEEGGLFAPDHRHRSGIIIIIMRQPESLKMPHVLRKWGGGNYNLW